MLTLNIPTNSDRAAKLKKHENCGRSNTPILLLNVFDMANGHPAAAILQIKFGLFDWS